MTAPTPTRTDLGALDQHIVRALVALRLARTVSARSKNAPNCAAEARAEENLNNLLDYRNNLLDYRQSTRARPAS